MISTEIHVSIVNWKTYDTVKHICRYFLDVHEQLCNKINLKPPMLSLDLSQELGKELAGIRNRLFSRKFRFKIFRAMDSLVVR